MFITERHQFINGDGCTINQLNKGTRHLSSMGIWLTNRAGKGNGRMGQKRFFDFRRINIVATANDQILGAASDP